MLDIQKFARILQNKFPLVSRPFRHMATTLVIEEKEVIDYVRRLKAAGIIRRIGPLFSPRAYGYQTCLMAIKASPKAEKNVVGYLNSHSTITHNYKRDAEYNIWFTYAYKTDSEKSDLIRELQTQFDINHLIELPSIKTYKLKTDFSLEEINLENLPSVHGLPEPAEPLIDIPITPMPFQQIGESMGIAEEDVILEIMQGMESGHIRRFGAILNHTKAGMTSNSLIVWKIPQDKVDTIGEIFAGQPFISHCYQRTPQPDWPYNLYTMLHARSLAEENKFIDQLKGEVKSHDLDHEYKRLDTIQEFKKTSFVPYDAGSSLSGKIRLR